MSRGRLVVLADDRKIFATLSDGDYFGEVTSTTATRCCFVVVVVKYHANTYRLYRLSAQAVDTASLKRVKCHCHGYRCLRIYRPTKD